jgi:hypothetical protein
MSSSLIEVGSRMIILLRVIHGQFDKLSFSRPYENDKQSTKKNLLIFILGQGFEGRYYVPKYLQKLLKPLLAIFTDFKLFVEL